MSPSHYLWRSRSESHVVAAIDRAHDGAIPRAQILDKNSAVDQGECNMGTADGIGCLRRETGVEAHTSRSVLSSDSDAPVFFEQRQPLLHREGTR